MRNRATETILLGGLVNQAPKWRLPFGVGLYLGTALRHSRVKRGNLYSEQHQIGIRTVYTARGGSSEYAGRWHELISNNKPR